VTSSGQWFWLTNVMAVRIPADERARIERAAELADVTYSDVIRAGVRRVLGDLESGAVIDLTPNSATPQP